MSRHTRKADREKKMRRDERERKEQIANKMRTLTLAGIVFLLVLMFLYWYTKPTAEATSDSTQLTTYAVPNPALATSGETPKSYTSKEAYDKVVQMYQNHPDEECRTNMTKWLEQKQVKIRVDEKEKLLQTSLCKPDMDQPGLIPCVKVNPRFLLLSWAKDSSRLELEHFNGLYHEHIHIRNHFNGINRFDNPSFVPEIAAKDAWESEYSAGMAEYTFLKKQNALDLWIDQRVINTEAELKTWVEMYYGRLQKSYNQEQVANFKPVWDKLFQQELKKLANN